jgi:RNA polymerase sigma-70 factor (ECF subfamily)
MHSSDRQAEFTELLAESRGRLFGYLYALAQNMDDTEELFQETALTLWRKFDEFESGSNFAAWATTTAQLLFRNFLKRKGRSRLQFGEGVLEKLACTQEELSHDDSDRRHDALAVCLEKLREKDRALVKLCYEGKQSTLEVAKQLHRSPESIYMALSRLRRSLFECIQRNIGGQEGGA